MVLRIDDTDVERNTEASLDSIYGRAEAGWALSWDEFYRQSERLDLHQQAGFRSARKRARLSRFHAGVSATPKRSRMKAVPGSAIPRCGRCRDEESDRRAAAGEPFVIRFVFRAKQPRDVTFHDLVYGAAIQIDRRYRRFRSAAQ